MIKKIVLLVFLGIVGLSILSFMGGNSQDSTPTLTPTPEIQASLSREQFELYNWIFSELDSLQTEYETLYAKLGYVGIDDDVAPEDFPRYGPITRKISEVRYKIPKLSTSMSDDERELHLRINTYASTLIFLSAKPDGLDGIDAVNEEREFFITKRDSIKSKLGY